LLPTSTSSACSAMSPRRKAAPKVTVTTMIESTIWLISVLKLLRTHR
jgi:hypothetical protein